MPDVFLYTGEVNPNDVVLSNPTTARANIFKSLTGAIASSGALTRQAGKSLAGTIASAGALAKSTARALAGTVTSSGAVLKQTNRKFTGVITSAGALLAGIRRALAVSGAIGPTGTVARSYVACRTFVGTLTSSGSLAKTISRTLTGAIASAGTLQKQTNRALSGVLSLVGTLANLGPNDIGVLFASVSRAVYRRDAHIAEALNDQPRSAILTVEKAREGFAPSVGMDTHVKSGPLVTVFGGTVQKTTQTYHGVAQNVYTTATVVDYRWLIDAKRITGVFTGSASTVLATILSSYASGFTGTHIQASMPTITLTCDDTTVGDAIAQIMAMVKGSWRIDETKDLHAFTVPEAGSAPAALTTANSRLTAYEVDLSQVRNRIKGTGKGTTMRLPTGFSLPAGSTRLPCADAAFFGSSGQAKLGKREVVTYSAKAVGGTASTVAGIPQSPGTPSAAVLAVGSWLTSPAVEPGTRSYKTTIVNWADEESETSAAASVTIPTISAPSVPTLGLGYASATVAIASLTRSGTTATASFSSVHGFSNGATVKISGSTGYDGRYQITVTGTTTFTFPVAGTPGSSSGNAQLAGAGPLLGSKQYKVAFRTRSGSTLASSASSAISPAAVGAFAWISGLTATTGGALTASSTYWYWTSTVTSLGEGPAALFSSVALSGAQNAVTVALQTVATLSGDGRITARRVYRGIAGGSSVGYLVAEITDPTVTSYVDKIADANIGAQMISEDRTGGGSIMLFGIAVSGDARVVGRDGYRLAADGTYKLAWTIGDNTTTSITDYADDTKLGAAEPTLDTSSLGQVTVSSIPLGNAGTIVVSGVAVPITKARRIYSTVAGGSTWQFVRAVDDNTTTSVTINTSDQSLGKEAPTSSSWRTVANNSSLRVLDLSQFPAAGWVDVGSQIISYTGRSGSSGEGTLTGIPASGVGSIVAEITATSTVTAVPFLALSSGTVYSCDAGDPLELYTVRNDTAAQTTLAGLTGRDGIYEGTLVDATLNTQALLDAACDAVLAQLSLPIGTITFDTYDTKCVPGATVTASYGAPTNVTGTFIIQTVQLSQLAWWQSQPKPLRTCVASQAPRASFDEFMRLARLDRQVAAAQA